MKLKFDIVRQARAINVIAASCLGLIGVLGLFQSLTDHTHGKMLIGIMCIIIGCAKLVGYFSNDLYRLAFEFDLAIGVLSVILGVLFLSLPEKFGESVPNSLAIYAMIDSTLKIQIGLDARRFGMKYWAVILAGGITVCAAAIVAIIATCVDVLSANDLFCLTLILLGLNNALVTAYTVRVRAKKKNFDEWLAEECFSDED